MDSESSSPLFSVGQELSTFLASSGFLHKAWEEIRSASVDNVDTFVLKEYEGVIYVVFSSLGIEDFIVKDSKYGECQIQNENRVFSPCLKGNDDQPALVHKGALRRFLYILENSDFKDKMQSFTKLRREQSIVFTGHSMGAAVATLATIWFLEKRVRQISPFCITFGSPLVGDVRLEEAIGRENWSGKFCHVVAKNDIVSRILLAPLESISEPLSAILPYYGSLMGNASMAVSHPSIQEACKALLNNVLQYTSTIANNYVGESDLRSPYRPFGTYMFCLKHGAVCIEDSEAVLKMLHFTMQSKEGMSFDEFAGACISEHIDYGNLLELVTAHLFNTIRIANPITKSSLEMAIALQLEAMGIGAQVDHAFLALRKAGEMKNKHDIKIEELNDMLRKNQKSMAGLEWYKGRCKDKGIGYYDSFKQQIDKKDFKANLYRKSLGSFWDDIVKMVENNELPSDFKFQNKWINAGTTYRRLVEPLDIAYFYRKHKGNESYLSQGGRPHRYIVLEKWMEEKDRTRIARDNKPRTKFASLTQDSCFWAHLEEASKTLTNLQQDQDQHQVMNTQLKESLQEFEGRVWSMIEDWSISAEVFLEQSSFMTWWKQYSQFQLQSPEWKPSSSLLKFMEDEKWKLEI
ncbi:protein EDS1B-like [Cryptomeria japonica]|uniref:protein EDS1B-like n=1 Tax=Cryptomeria japonica TaxID=3369 RepID=UPI0027DA222F|nr:protein EDS1B-like [Cryptomeria japonica]